MHDPYEHLATAGRLMLAKRRGDVTVDSYKFLAMKRTMLKMIQRREQNQMRRRRRGRPEVKILEINLGALRGQFPE